MDTMWKITEADRDAAGNIKVGGDEPRSLADLLPTPKAIKQDARRQPWTRVELATLAAVALMAALVLISTPGPRQERPQRHHRRARRRCRLFPPPQRPQWHQ